MYLCAYPSQSHTHLRNGNLCSVGQNVNTAIYLKRFFKYVHDNGTLNILMCVNCVSA